MLDLTKIKHPAFLKELTIDELNVLANEIRQFLIGQLATTGGHLGSNLGVVELTIALHSEFNSPEDKILFDVGHQSYTHKILTGRAAEFKTLRHYKGLSGFLKRSESEHDLWEAGHSSTSLSAAMGMALARDLNKQSQYIVPLIGDGALTGGMALEALNHIGAEKKDLIVILNDNEMSIGHNVGAIDQALARMRSAGNYTRVKESLEALLLKIPGIGGFLADTTMRLKDSMKYLMIPGILFEELGFTYFGPIDGHDIQILKKHLSYAKKTKGPVLIHVITKKGKGYLPAENDNKDKWHGVGPYKIKSGEKIKLTNQSISWSQVVSDALIDQASRHPEMVVITPAMILGSKLEAFAEKYPDRLFDVGIAEQHATTMAAGLASQGIKPFLSIYSSFLQRAYDQILHDICRTNLNVIIGVDRAGLVGADGETHQGVFDISFLRALPNIIIMMPKDENECRDMIETSMDYDTGPIAIRYPRGQVSHVLVREKSKSIPIGKWEVLTRGKDLTILTFGSMISVAKEAVRVLESNNVSVELVNARFIKPLDKNYLIKLFKSGRPILTMEEAVLAGGFGSSIMEFADQSNHLAVKIKRIGIPDYFIQHGDVKALLEEVGLTAAQIIEAAEQILPTFKQRVRYNDN